MPDQLFFKKLHDGQWLGLRLPSDLELVIEGDGTFRASKTWHYVGAPRPANIRTIAFVVLENTDTGFSPTLREVAGAGPGDDPFTVSPFSDSLAAIGEPGPDDSRRRMTDAIRELLTQPALPLFLYDVYRKAPRGRKVTDPLDYLIGLAGGSRGRLRLEALSQMLFIATCDT